MRPARSSPKRGFDQCDHLVLVPTAAGDLSAGVVEVAFAAVRASSVEWLEPMTLRGFGGKYLVSGETVRRVFWCCAVDQDRGDAMCVHEVSRTDDGF